MFNSYVKLPDGNHLAWDNNQWSMGKTRANFRVSFASTNKWEVSRKEIGWTLQWTKNNVDREYVHEYVCNVWGTGWRERLLEVAILTMKATLQQWWDPSTLAGVPETWAQQKEQQGLLRRVEHLWTQQVLWHLSRRRSGHTKPLLLQHSFWELEELSSMISTPGKIPRQGNYILQK